MTKKSFDKEWKKSISIWIVFITCISSNLSSSWSNPWILSIETMCTLFLDHVTEKISSISMRFIIWSYWTTSFSSISHQSNPYHTSSTCQSTKVCSFSNFLLFDFLRLSELVVVHLSISTINIKRKSFPPMMKFLNWSENLILFFSIESSLYDRFYSVADSHCEIPINLPFNDDITIHLTHAAIGHSRQTHVILLVRLINAKILF